MRMEKLHISENGRYFEKADGSPFVWLAEGLAEGLTGKCLKYDSDREEWKKLLITYHACHEAETGECSTFSY